MENLPPEIIEIIFKEIDYETVININKKFKSLFLNRQHFFENITIDLSTIKKKDLIKIKPKKLKIIWSEKISKKNIETKINLINK